jgi:hypothetical protein
MDLLWPLAMGDFWNSSAKRAARRAKNPAKYEIQVGYVAKSERKILAQPKC